jgi:hypothetical protein
MQVAVSPSHYNLKDIVQAIEVDTSGYLNTPPNGRFAAMQSNFEFVKGQGNGRDHWITKKRFESEIVNGISC